MGRPSIPVKEKPCKQCRKMMQRQRYNGTLESRLNYKRRIFCNRDCMTNWMEGQIKVPSVKAGHRQSGKKVKSECEFCARTKTRLYVHHMDENPMNNADENLKTLCGSCHRRMHSPNFTGTPPQRKSCSLCSKPAERKGYCDTHLTRLKKYGDPLLTKKRTSSGWQLVRAD